MSTPATRRIAAAAMGYGARDARTARLPDLGLAHGARLHRRGCRGKALVLAETVCAFVTATAAALYLV